MSNKLFDYMTFVILGISQDPGFGSIKFGISVEK